MKYYLIALSVITSFYGFSQPGEEIGPLGGNPQLMSKGIKNVLSKANDETFDSTFIYTSDTLSMPFFDDFSSDKFQAYNVGFADPGVTSILEYKLLDYATSQPIANNVFYTQQQTFRRTVDLQTTTTTDVDFPAIQVKWGDMEEYPTVYTTIDVYPPYYIYDTIANTGGTDPNPDTVWITGPEIYQDSARQFFATLNDPSAYWLDNEAFLNNTMGVDPWSIGVATFDGLDQYGYPYAIGTTTTNYADHLTSKPIDMSGLNAADSVYMSFMYQFKGWSDQPEPGDSLILEFYAKDLDQWNHIWSVSGGALDQFTIAHIPVENTDYFKDGFQFRFKNYGGLSGSLDHFHIDYVHLRSIPGFGASADTLLRDIAFSYPIYTLLEDYTSVPWDHYKNLTDHNAVMSDSVQIVMANSFPGQINANDGNMEIYDQQGLDGTVLLVSDVLCDEVSDNYQGLDIPYSYHDVRSSYTFDATLPGISQSFEIKSAATGGASNFAGNDSTVTTQVFENYYSYDDGTAELAYGPTGIQSRLAIQYTPYEADTLIGVMIHFVPSVTDVSNNLFYLTIWDDNNGQPGNVIYEDNTFHPRTPHYNYAHNAFTYYFLEDTMWLPIDGTFYVGWRQLEAERLNVGLDMNIASNEHTFYSVDGEISWDQSTIEGSVMIRPIFSTGMDVTLGVEVKEPVESEVIVYPNPTTGKLSIKTDMLIEQVQVFNLQGQELLTTNEETFDVSYLPAGMYYVRVNGQSRLHKVIKK